MTFTPSRPVGPGDGSGTPLRPSSPARSRPASGSTAAASAASARCWRSWARRFASGHGRATAAILLLAASARHLVRDLATLLLACQLITAAVAFIANILAARALQPTGRGELALLLQIGYMVSLGLLLGTPRSVIAVYTDAPARTVARAFVRLLVAPSTLCLAAVVAVLGAPIPGLGSWRGDLALALVFAVTNAFVRTVRAIAIAARRKQDLVAYSLCSNGLVLTQIVLLFLLDVENSAIWLLAYLLAGTASAGAWLTAWSCRGHAPDVPGQPDSARREARREGLKLFPLTLARSGVLRLDRLLLAGLVGAAALGIYATVGTMIEVIAWPLVAFADSRLAAWREAYDRGDLALRRLFVLAGAYCAAAPVLMAAAAHVVLVPLLGPAYRSAGELVLPLAVASGVFGMTHLTVTMLIAIRRTVLASVAEVTGFGVTVASYLVFISEHGTIGAAYGSLVGYIGCFAIAGGLLRVCLRARPSRRRSA